MTPTPPPVRLAFWSGPRNISTALLRAWGARADAAVTDEPLYAAYLAATGKDHPGRAAILAAQPTDWRAVADALTGPVPGGRELWVQKHMAHHLLPHVGRGWLTDPAHGFRHAFLIREPAAMLASLARVTPDPALEDTGLPQQAELFDREADRLGHAPPVVDGRDVRAAPEPLLRALCDALGVAWDPAMLSWEPGPRETDGVWAPHWYGRVWETTGWEPPPPETDPPALPDGLRPVLDAARPFYERLAEHRLGAEDDGRLTAGAPDLTPSVG